MKQILKQKSHPYEVYNKSYDNNDNDILLRTHGPYHRQKSTKVISHIFYVSHKAAFFLVLTLFN